MLRPSFSLAVALAAAVTLAPAVVRAHPHVHIETGIAFLFDAEGRVSGLRLRWSYDPDTSDILLEDRGYALRPDGTLSASDLADFAGTDVNWDYEGFEGDVYLFADDAAVTLEEATDFAADYRRDQFVTWHTRPLAVPLDPEAAEVLLKVYDPTFFALYTVERQTATEGRDDCTVTVVPPDLEEAYEKLMALLSVRPEDMDIEMDYPPVGQFYADEIFLECGPGS